MRGVKVIPAVDGGWKNVGSGPLVNEKGRCQNRSRSPWSASNMSNGSQRRSVPLVFLTGAIVCWTMSGPPFTLSVGVGGRRARCFRDNWVYISHLVRQLLERAVRDAVGQTAGGAHVFQSPSPSSRAA